MDTKLLSLSRFAGQAETYVADSFSAIQEDISAFTSKSNTTTFKVQLLFACC